MPEKIVEPRNNGEVQRYRNTKKATPGKTRRERNVAAASLGKLEIDDARPDFISTGTAKIPLP